MIAKKALIIDNNITNSDWTKANAFDFPGVKTVQDFELQFGVPASEPARSERLTELKKYPWAKATPRPIHDLLFYDLFQKMSLINLIKASFSGDRSAAGRYAAQQRWKNHQKKTEKPKDDDTPPIDPRLVQAKKILEDAFKGDVISTLRLAGTRQGNEQTGIEISSPSGIATNRPPRKEELLLAQQIEAAGALIDQVVGSELAKIENAQVATRSTILFAIQKLESKVKPIQAKNMEVSQAISSAMTTPDTEETKDALGKINSLYDGGENYALNAPRDVQSAVLTAQRKISSLIVTGKIGAEKLSSLSDNDLLELVSRDTSSYGRGDKRISRMNTYGDSHLHSRIDLTENPPYTREQKNQAFLTLIRQQINGEFGNTVRSQAPKLGDVKQNIKMTNDLSDERQKLKDLVVTPAQRQAIVKKALSDVGVEFGKAGQVPVSIQGKKIVTSGFSLAAPRKETRSADETARGRKFQGLIDEAVQLLPKKLWEGSERPNTLSPGTKMATKIELDIKNGRAHAQKLQANLGVSITTKLKLNSLKVDEEPSTEWRSVALHEMGHAAENGNTWLTQMEYAYWESRKGNEPIQRLSKLTGNSGYKPNEIASKDKWAEPYAGKVYDQSRTSAFEIFTMGIEGVFYGTRKIDPEHRAFTLGLLALSTQVKD